MQCGCLLKHGFSTVGLLGFLFLSLLLVFDQLQLELLKALLAKLTELVRVRSRDNKGAGNGVTDQDGNDVTQQDILDRKRDLQQESGGHDEEIGYGVLQTNGDEGRDGKCNRFQYAIRQQSNNIIFQKKIFY